MDKLPPGATSRQILTMANFPESIKNRSVLSRWRKRLPEWQKVPEHLQEACKEVPSFLKRADSCKQKAANLKGRASTTLLPDQLQIIFDRILCSRIRDAATTQAINELIKPAAVLGCLCYSASSQSFSWILSLRKTY
jgi:hypothetical protein